MPCSCCCCTCCYNEEDENKGQWDRRDSQYDTLPGQLVVASEESENCTDYLTRSFHIISISLPSIFVEAILVLLSFLMFVLGCKYDGECPRQPLIIIYHIIGGGVGFLFTLWLLVRAVRRRRQESGLDDDDDHSVGGHGYTDDSTGKLKDNGIWFMELVALLFLCSWFLMGNYWTWTIYMPDGVMSLEKPLSWCDRTLYMFTLVSFAILYFVILFGFILVTGLLTYARFCVTSMVNE
ncbi:unnamed protein product [Didymodactylos carnosus]|uniref:Uncharacterized protein n=2 Tax=Didymodactylos carnosus TaxID=1234261 RepID=A0A815B1V5_9BILA|nr:unnamed protein product [Didymodactylos carnosus]CAF4049023.1 unnamed protein product [Didymodactylos carnosus]